MKFTKFKPNSATFKATKLMRLACKQNIVAIVAPKRNKGVTLNPQMPKTAQSTQIKAMTSLISN